MLNLLIIIISITTINKSTILQDEKTLAAVREMITKDYNSLTSLLTMLFTYASHISYPMDDLS